MSLPRSHKHEFFFGKKRSFLVPDSIMIFHQVINVHAWGFCQKYSKTIRKFYLPLGMECSGLHGPRSPKPKSKEKLDSFVRKQKLSLYKIRSFWVWIKWLFRGLKEFIEVVQALATFPEKDPSEARFRNNSQTGIDEFGAREEDVFAFVGPDHALLLSCLPSEFGESFLFLVEVLEKTE